MLRDLESHRLNASKLFVVLLWLHVPLNFAISSAFSSDPLWIGLASLGAAALATATSRFAPSPASVRSTLAIGYMMTISLLLAGMRGSSWQIDVHMYYFAALALITVYCDWRAIVAATATVAVHHLGLNFLLPRATYTSGGGH